MTNRPCTCHPDDNPPRPCQQKYALSECKAAPAPDAATVELPPLPDIEQEVYARTRTFLRNDEIVAVGQLMEVYASEAIRAAHPAPVAAPNWQPVPPRACIKPTPEAADAFWKYWRENGETHKHGYYESTWGAINAALACGFAAPPADESINALRDEVTLLRASNARLLAEKSNGRLTEAQIEAVLRWSATAEAVNKADDEAVRLLREAREDWIADEEVDGKPNDLGRRIDAYLAKANVELTGSRAGSSPVRPATEGSEVERRVGGQADASAP